MRLVVIILLGSFFHSLVLGNFFNSLTASSLPLEGFADLVEKLMPAVVNISVEQKADYAPNNRPAQRRPSLKFPGLPEEFNEFFERLDPFSELPQSNDLPRDIVWTGSGFVIDARGYIVTNNHVIGVQEEGGRDITITFNDGTSTKAVLIGRDARSDLAVLKVDLGKNMPFVEFGDSEKSRVGDLVLAIGNPFGLGSSASTGIISARSREINLGTVVSDFIQTDAAINKGNSGGPLFNTKGQVIGINTAIYSTTGGGSLGIGFAIPANAAKSIIAKLKDGKKIEHGWLGVRVQAVTPEIAESLGLKEPTGALVANVDSPSPASKAGLKPGDLILEFDGVKVKNMQQLPRIVSATPINKEVKILVLRQQREVSIGARITKFDLEEDKSSHRKIKSLGLTVSQLSKKLRDKYNIEDKVKGLVILQTDGRAKYLREGEVISAINGVPVEDVKTFIQELKKAASNNRSSVLLLVYSSNESRFVTVKINGVIE